MFDGIPPSSSIEAETAAARGWLLSPLPPAAMPGGDGLAPYALRAEHSRGRRHAEPAAPTRDAFQRDRDRIVHSTAFRRLVYKTQVFLNHEGDLFRTRLTHSLEVAQLARSLARGLGLNEDLVESLALAHDLGHTPFGHAGQDQLNHCMREHGGFEHNLQSLRVVDLLEHRYPDFDGLNLSFETREGILKHCSRANALMLEAAEPGGVASRFLPQGRPKAENGPLGGQRLHAVSERGGDFHGREASLEAQLCNLADSIAYNAHDIDDGVRSGLIALDAVREVPLFRLHCDAALAQHPNLQGRRLLYEAIRRMLSTQVYDVLASSSQAIARHAPDSPEAARKVRHLVRFSDAMQADSTALKRFLFRHLYRHPQVVRMTDKAKAIVADLFAIYLDSPGEMRPSFAERPDRARAVADYIAGMTDRFASREHERLTGKRLLDS